METMPVPVVAQHSLWFRKQMSKLGYRQGETADFVLIKAMGDKKRAETMLRQALERGRPDVVVTFATLAAQAAQKVLAKSGIPLIFSVVADPVGAGLIKKVGQPTGTNITGLAYSLFRKPKVEMAMRLVSQIVTGRPARFGVIHCAYPSSRGDLAHLNQVAKSRGDVQFIAREIPYRAFPQGLPAMLADFRKAADELAGKVDFWWQATGPLYEIRDTTEILLRHGKTPLIYGNTLGSVRDGALLAIIPDFREGGRETARLAHAVLTGRDPGKIPVVIPRSFNLAVNLSTALKLKIAVPSDVMTMAGSKVFR